MNDATVKAPELSEDGWKPLGNIPVWDHLKAAHSYRHTCFS